MDVTQVLAAHGIGGQKKTLSKVSFIPLLQNADSRDGTIDKDLNVYSYGVNTKNINKFDSDGNFIWQRVLTTSAWGTAGILASPDGQKLFGGVMDSGTNPFSLVHEYDIVTGTPTQRLYRADANTYWVMGVGPSYELYIWFLGSLLKYTRNADGTYSQAWSYNNSGALCGREITFADDGTIMYATYNTTTGKPDVHYINPNGTLQKKLTGPVQINSNSNAAFDTKTKSYMVMESSQIAAYDYNNVNIFKSAVKTSAYPSILTGRKGFAYILESNTPTNSDASSMTVRKIRFDGTKVWQKAAYGQTWYPATNPLNGFLGVRQLQSYFHVYNAIQE